MAGAAISASYIKVQQKTYEEVRHTTNAGEVVAGVLVGQTFVSPHDNLSGVAVMFANYSNRANTEIVEFHLRASVDAKEDLRTATVRASKLGDNQFYRFTFEPIKISQNSTYFFYLTSPTSRPGNAITVDLNTQDPYHLGSAYLIRNGGENLPTFESIEKSGKQTVDVVFGLYHTVSLRIAVRTATVDLARTFRAAWKENRSEYIVWTQLLLATLIYLSFIILVSRKDKVNQPLAKKTVLILLGLLFFLGFYLRWLYADRLPLTNDEGNYLYDAQTLLRGNLAGGDGYVKAPLVILWSAIWQFLLGSTIMAGRFSSILIGALTILPVYTLGRLFRDERTGIVAAASWALLGAPIVFNIYVHTQPVAMFFGASGIAMLWHTLGLSTKKKAYFKGGQPTRRLVYAGILLGLGVASRKSILALGLVPLLLILTSSGKWQQRLGRLIMFGIGFGLVIGLLLGWALLAYGPQGVIEAIGLNSAEDGISAVDPDEAQKIIEYSIRGLTPFFREALPLIFFALLGWGFLLEKWLYTVTSRLITNSSTRIWKIFMEYVIPKIVWFMPAWVLLQAASFFFEYEGSIFHNLGGIRWLWYVMAFFLIALALWPRLDKDSIFVAKPPLTPHSTQPKLSSDQKLSSIKSTQSLNVPVLQTKNNISTQTGFIESSATTQFQRAIIPFLWIVGLIVFYMNWIKFHANYIVEFLLPLTMIAGIGALGLWQRTAFLNSPKGSSLVKTISKKVVATGVGLVIIWIVYVSNYITLMYEHTGTFDQGAAQEAAAWAAENIPLEQAIFTGAAIVPYLSGHQTVLDIAHPRWYAYEFTRKNPTRLNTFLPSAEAMQQAFAKSQWVLLEQQTSFSFLMEYSEIERSLAEDFFLVHEVDNGSNTLKFYRRFRST